MVEIIENINDAVNEVVWGIPFMVLLIGTGLYLTIRLRFFQFTHLITAWNETFGTFFTRRQSGEAGAITSFQAVSSAMAGTIGVGNIAGVSAAIATGGPGAVFWMWISALVGMATKFGEASLAVKYREIDPETGEVSGGVMYSIQNGLGQKWKPLAVLYAILSGFAAFGIGNMVQSNTVASELQDRLDIPGFAVGIVLLIFVGLVTLGGITRIAQTTEKIVPFMAILYMLASLIIIVLNLPAIPAAIGSIFYYAFNPSEAIGSFEGAAVGMAVQFGFARGIFSNEAGLGATSIVHAQAKNTPARQGMWGIWEVFIDTIIVCTMTALPILVTGSLGTGETGAVLASTSFDAALPGAGGWIITIGIVLFAYSTMLTWNFYGEKSWEYVFGSRVVIGYRVLFLGFIFVGAIGGLELVWGIADTMNGLMAAPNLISLLLLAKPIVGAKNNYFKFNEYHSELVLEVDDDIEERYPNLPLGKLGIVSDFSDDQVQVIFINQLEEGNFDYIYSWYEKEDIRRPILEQKQGEEKVNLQTAQEIASVIKEQLKAKSEIEELKQHQNKVNKLISLVSKSDVYQSQQEVYQKALKELETLINKAEELEQVYARFIQELLIGREVAAYDADQIPNSHFSIHERSKKIKEDYQQMKDTVTAYNELLNGEELKDN